MLLPIFWDLNKFNVTSHRIKKNNTKKQHVATTAMEFIQVTFRHPQNDPNHMLHHTEDLPAMMKSHSPQHAESLDQLKLTAQYTLCLVLLQMKLIMLIMLIV